MPLDAASPAARRQPVTPPMRSRSGIMKSQDCAASARSMSFTSEKFSPICTGVESARATSAQPVKSSWRIGS